MVNQDHQTKHVVFAEDTEGCPTHMLDVVEGTDELEESMNKWWKAFHTGEKAEPRDYDGIGHRPVARYDQWKDGDRDE